MSENQEEKLPEVKESIEELLKKVEELEKEKEQYLENLKRAKNDVLRIKNEYEAKFEEVKNLANAELIYSLLGVLDAFELAIEKAPENEINKGFFLIYSQLKDILEKFGLREINPLNQKFDPNFHEAISSQKCQRENCFLDDDNLIIEVYSKGYLYQGRVLRPARVKVINH